MTRPPLSPRQREVLAHVAAGLPNHEIAALLHIDNHTVGTHVRDINRRWGTTNRTEVVVLAIYGGLVDLPAAAGAIATRAAHQLEIQLAIHLQGK